VNLEVRTADPDDFDEADDEGEMTLADECTAQYRAETDRLRLLLDVVRPYLPHYSTHSSAEDLRSLAHGEGPVAEARNWAVIACFDAIRRSASQFAPPETR
jgi:hypothetical protein